MSADEVALLKPEAVTLKSGTSLNEVGRPAEHVYFPDNGIISLMAVAPDGKRIQTAFVGRDGFIGAIEYAPVTVAIAITSLRAKRIRATKYKDALNKSEALRKLTLDYSTKLLGQVQVNAVCNAVHSLSERSARLLSELSAIAESDTFHLTQHRAASLIAVRRTSVSAAFIKLAAEGLICYNRGNVTILKNKKLHAAACGCLAHTSALIRQRLS